ncbi:hypothetical protein [Streptomyces sp. NPDC021622]|uniref:hypothetical protein n=1 Tax=Streptomyces sp. NPDC021622 TaxID=3155013 RepID=UPI0033C213C2
MIDDYRLYLHHRWLEGCTNASALTREIQQLGYRGGMGTVQRHLRAYRTGEIPTDTPLPQLTVRRVTDWIMRGLEQLTDTERKGLDDLCARNPALAMTTEYARRLAVILRERRNEHLASRSGSPKSASTDNANSAPWPTACGATTQPSSRPSPPPVPRAHLALRVGQTCSLRIPTCGPPVWGHGSDRLLANYAKATASATELIFDGRPFVWHGRPRARRLRRLSTRPRRRVRAVSSKFLLLRVRFTSGLVGQPRSGWTTS